MPDNRKGFASALHIRGLRQRWMFSAVLPILLLLVLAVALFSVGVQEYYYNAMRSGLESRARIAAETFTGYGVKSYSEYYRLASYSAETFEEKGHDRSSSSSTRTERAGLVLRADGGHAARHERR
mgnify:CR=1 FL=1